MAHNRADRPQTEKVEKQGNPICHHRLTPAERHAVTSKILSQRDLHDRLFASSFLLRPVAFWRLEVLGRLDCLLCRVHLPAQHEGLRADLAGRAGTVGNAAEHDISGTAASLAIVAAGREFLVQRNVAKTHVRAAHDLLRPDAEDAVRFRGRSRSPSGRRGSWRCTVTCGSSCAGGRRWGLRSTACTHCRSRNSRYTTMSP